MSIKDMSVDELEKRLDEVVVEISHIKTQLEFAKADYDRTGVKADQTWYFTAKRALRLRGREHQGVMVELSQRKKQIRCERNSTIERKFLDLARVRLPKEDFARLFAEAEILAAIGSAEGQTP
jgi:hypothetical protein